MELIVIEHEMEVTYRLPQGSVIGPTKWHIYYDDVFRLPVLQGVILLDKGITIVGETLKQIAKVAIYTLTIKTLARN